MPTKIPTEIMHIEWIGPFSVAQVQSLTKDEDYGVYQVYGGHAIYGSDTLLYIGQANMQTFAVRIRQHKSWLDFNQDAEHLRFYMGRIAGEITPPDKVWNEQIDFAERLLVYACRPAYNSQQHLTAKLDTKLQKVHILNWGQFRDLLPEVSGARWTSKYDDMPKYHVFGSEAEQ